MDIRIHDRQQYRAACEVLAALKPKLAALEYMRASCAFLEDFASRHVNGLQRDLYASGPLDDIASDLRRVQEALGEAVTRYAESDRDADVRAA